MAVVGLLASSLKETSILHSGLLGLVFGVGAEIEAAWVAPTFENGMCPDCHSASSRLAKRTNQAEWPVQTYTMRSVTKRLTIPGFRRAEHVDYEEPRSGGKI